MSLVVDEKDICVDCGNKVERTKGKLDGHLCPYRYWGTNSYGKNPRW